MKGPYVPEILIKTFSSYLSYSTFKAFVKLCESVDALAHKHELERQHPTADAQCQDIKARACRSSLKMSPEAKDTSFQMPSKETGWSG